MEERGFWPGNPHFTVADYHLAHDGLDIGPRERGIVGVSKGGLPKQGFKWFNSVADDKT